MANGSGDIKITDVSYDQFRVKPQEDRDWLMLMSIQSLSQTCHGRPKECEKRYVRVKHVAVASLVLLSFLAGMGVLQIQVIMPALIKQAVAAAMMAP